MSFLLAWSVHRLLLVMPAPRWTIRSWIAIWTSSPVDVGRTLREVADLKTFFMVLAKDPRGRCEDVFELLAHQRGDRTVVRLVHGSMGCRHARAVVVVGVGRSTRLWTAIPQRRPVAGSRAT
jgi:hypothetical protein